MDKWWALLGWQGEDTLKCVGISTWSGETNALVRIISWNLERNWKNYKRVYKPITMLCLWRQTQLDVKCRKRYITDCCDFSAAHVQSITAEENLYYSGTDRQLRIELAMDNKAGVLTFWLVQSFNVLPMIKASFTTKTVSTHHCAKAVLEWWFTVQDMREEL